MTIKYLYSFILSLLLFCACQSDKNIPEPPNLSQELVTKHLAELSKDYYEGRKPFTRGEERTIAYLEKACKDLGLKPGNNGSYIQEVPLLEITGNPSPTININCGTKSLDLKLKNDYITFTNREQEQIDLKDSELVFCGYGIVAPEYDWNDYEGIDMKGKTAIVIVNDPGFGATDSTFFKGNTMTYYGRWTYKYEEAMRQGAEGIMIIHETTLAGYPWFVVTSSWSGSLLGLQPTNGNKDWAALQGWITLDAAEKIFELSGQELKSMFKQARQAGFKPIPLDCSMSGSLSNTFKRDVSKNVIATIEGKERPEEYIIYSAHWDHLGIGPVVNGDSIYNGALDNGGGMAITLAVAETMSNMSAPDRSVAFLFVTAEEQGLLGSQYYAEHPIIPIDQSIANINIDGINPAGKMKDFTVIGYGHSTMDDLAAEEAKKQGRYVLKGQEPEKGYFFRSDHFNFAKVGIPALFAEGGYDHWDKGKKYAEEFKKNYLAKNYHQPSDEYDADTWNLKGAMQDAQLYLNIGNRLANSKEVPEWKKGSEFANARP